MDIPSAYVTRAAELSVPWYVAAMDRMTVVPQKVIVWTSRYPAAACSDA